MVKRFILKQKLKQNASRFVLKGYPEKLKHILVIFKEFDPQTEQFLAQLELYFKGSATVHKASLTTNTKQGGIIALKKNTINFKGIFKDIAFNILLNEINLIIDISQMDSLVKNYAISLAPEAYKISLNSNSNSQFQLTIEVDPQELDQFFDEFVKYHNALKHG